MSSEGSVTSLNSQIQQFGLYRTIDAKTDEFLKASRKRQIRQGCACAAISTAITVTIVVVILLIYEYAIAVEWSLVQNKKGVNRTDGIGSDQPFADRLDRSYFGFDQEYYERMPLLINAMQESSNIDSSLEISGPISKKRQLNLTILKTTNKPTIKPSPIRRTSPRPFYFEYRHPTPLPFSKLYGSRSWIERYRNEERLKNIRQIIKYLENTINAKAGDMHSNPTEKHIAFSGVYVEPMIENAGLNNKANGDLQPASSDNFKKFHINHLADPLFNFKPENPGDVNLLADDYLRFSPTPSLIKTTNRHPMFRQILTQNRNCQGIKCQDSRNENKLLQSSSEIKQIVKPSLSNTKSFSVMLNLYPMKGMTENRKLETTTTTQSINKIYFTTSRPIIQFKRKSNVRRAYTPYKRPKYLSHSNNDYHSEKVKETKKKESTDPVSHNMILHVNVYDENVNASSDSNTVTPTSFVPSTQTNPYTTKAPIEFSTSEIEDHHIGSSGYIPISTKANKYLPKVTTLMPFFDTTTEYWNSPTATPTEVVKFSIEDAKVPDHYIDLNQRMSEDVIEGDIIDVNRRSSSEMIDHEDLLKDINTTGGEMQTNRRNYVKEVETNVEPSTLIVKLKTDLSKTTTDVSNKNKQDSKFYQENTTTWTYVPQINGHYRSINQNSRNVNRWLDGGPENNRKKRLEMSVSQFQTYVPMYVEIKRNNNKTSTNEE